MNPWKKCPVDGTPFFHATTEFPLGRPTGSRFCSADCAARAGDPEASGRTAAFYAPRVDGTFGTAFERFNGGPVTDHDGNYVANPADFEEGSRFKQGEEE